MASVSLFGKQESRMAYGTDDEALSLILWLKIGSGEVSQDWDKFMVNRSKYKKCCCLVSN